MTAEAIVRAIHDLFLQCVAALEDHRYAELFWLMHERLLHMNQLQNLATHSPLSDLEEMREETSILFQAIQRRSSEVSHALSVELSTAEARRSYARSMGV